MAKKGTSAVKKATKGSFKRDWYYDQFDQLATDTVTVDRDNELVTYHPDIRSDENHTRSAEPEGLVHGLIIGLLCSPQYRYPRGAVWHEKHYAHGSKGSLSDEVDILVEDADGLPYALWEIKPPSGFASEKAEAIKNQLFGTVPLVGAPKLLVYATVRPTGAKAKIDAVCIDYTKFKSYEAWIDAGSPHTTAFPVDYQDLEYEPFVNGGTLDLKLDCTQADFRAVASIFHHEFFGEHPDNTLFVSLMKCLLAKIHDEKTTKKDAPYQFQVFTKNSKPESAGVVFKRVNSLYKSAYERYIDPGTTEKDEINPKEFAEERVKAVVQALQGMSITKGAALHGDVIGAFFEEILRSGFKQDKGMYFTHDNLVRFMVEAVDLHGLTIATWKAANHPENRLPYIIDPACGSGTFLLHSMEMVSATIRSKKATLVNDFDAEQFYNARMSDAMPNYWAEAFIYGLDPKFIMAITAKVNMVLHGDGSTHIFKSDAFQPLSTFVDPRLRTASEAARSIPRSVYDRDLCERFDLVISNPPFGITIPADSRSKLSKTFSLPESVPSEALFLERCFQLLKPRGRLAIVLPESLLNAGELLDVRLFIYRYFSIRSIVALPRNAFIDTPTLTSLVFAQKKTNQEISAWDSEWSAAFAAAEARLKVTRDAIKSTALENPKQVEEAFLASIAPLACASDWVLKSGKDPEVLPLSLPASASSADDAREYYKGLLKTAGFARILQAYLFGVVAGNFDYEFPVYMVDEIGYKLSKRKEKARPNQLCRLRLEKGHAKVTNLHLIAEDYEVVVDSKHPEAVLDFLRRDVSWA